MRIAGVDEVGRGPLVGDVVTAAVILARPIEGLADSKKLTPKKREYLAKKIQDEALCFAYGRASITEIDTLNIHHATLLAMQRAIDGLTIQPDKVLVDGIHLPPGLSVPAEAIVGGDGLIPEIAAASILAKVLRDEEMLHLDGQYPQYGFKSHKGYPTKQHLQALAEHGITPFHRMSYAPVRNIALRSTSHAEMPLHSELPDES